MSIQTASMAAIMGGTGPFRELFEAATMKPSRSAAWLKSRTGTGPRAEGSKA